MLNKPQQQQSDYLLSLVDITPPMRKSNDPQNLLGLISQQPCKTDSLNAALIANHTLHVQKATTYHWT